MLKLVLDASLRSATKPALLNLPEGRGRFDSMVVEELEKSFAAKIEELSNVIVNGQPASEARAAVVTEAESKVAEAEAVQKAAAEALAIARAAQKEAQASAKAAKASLTEYKPEYKKATESRDQQQEQVQTFMDVNVASFDMLTSKISSKKKKAIAAEAAEAEAAAKAVDESESPAKIEEAAEVGAEAVVTKAALFEVASSAAEATTEMSIDEVPKVVEAPASLSTAANLGA